VPGRPRRIVFVASAIWLATALLGLGTLWADFGTGFMRDTATANGAVATSDQLLLIGATFVALVAVTVGYATVGALLAGRSGAGRISALLLAGGALFALIPFGYIFGGALALYQPRSTLVDTIQLLGPVAIGPGFATILPALALAFPDGRLPSPRWRWPVAVAVGVIGLATFLQLTRPGALIGAAAGARRNPFGIDAMPAALSDVAFPLVSIGILAITLFGVVAVVVRYKRGDPVARQQLRWFLAAVSIAALPLALTAIPPIGGPATALVAAIGLILVPIAVGIAVTRYRLYEIDHLISRTLVYVPLTALLAGLYAATVTLLQRVFQSVTGDKSDAAVIISTLILASVFTPLRKWLEGIVERRFKPVAVSSGEPVLVAADWDARMTAIAERVVGAELARRSAEARRAKD